MNPPISYLNLAATAKSLAILDSYTSQAQNAAPMEFYAGDVTPRGFAFLLPSYDAASPYPFFFQDPAGFASFEVKVGAIGQEPDGGTFTISGTLGGTTAAIDYNATAADVATALQGGVTGLLDCSVSGPDGGPYLVDSQHTIDPTLDISSDAEGLAPDGSDAIIVKTQTANGSLTNRWTITLVRAYLVLNDTWSPLDPVGVAATPQQAGGGGQSLVTLLTWNPDSYGGTVTFAVTKPDASTFTVSLPYNVDGPTVDQTILTAAGVPELVTFTQKGDSGNYTVTFTGAWANDAVVNLTYESNALLVPVGYQAPLTVSTSAADALLADGSSSVEVIVVMRLTKAVGQPATVVQTPGTLIRTFPIGGNAGTNQPSNLTVHTGINWIKGIVDYVGGGSTNLDGLSTTQFNSLDAIQFRHTSGIPRQFFFANPDTTLADGVNVVEPLDNSGARWISML